MDDDCDLDKVGGEEEELRADLLGLGDGDGEDVEKNHPASIERNRRQSMSDLILPVVCLRRKKTIFLLVSNQCKNRAKIVKNSC